LVPVHGRNTGNQRKQAIKRPANPPKGFLEFFRVQAACGKYQPLEVVALLIADCAAASLAIGTLKGEQET
jgi:hypothetical protein